MKIVDAKWEVRNLGCKTLKLVIEKSDTERKMGGLCAQIEQEIRSHEAKYIVVEADTRYGAISQRLQREGFCLIEVLAFSRLTRDDAVAALKKFAPFNEGAGYHEASADEMDMIVREVKKGMFRSDRVAMDPVFGIEVANRRYANWIRDEVERGAYLYVDTYEDRPIGFHINRKLEHGRVNGLMNGLFTAEEFQGYGSLLEYAGYLEMVDHGMKVEKGGFSMNNPRAVQIHQLYGNLIMRLANVFVKHY